MERIFESKPSHGISPRNILSLKNSGIEFFPGLKELIDLYGEIDSRIEEFKGAAGLKCLPFCKACCSSLLGEIEASVFECLPLGVHLWQTGDAELILRELDQAGSDHPCPLCTPDDTPPASWGCRFYRWRPLICRLFAFSAVLDKHGRAKIALCRTLKELEPDAEDRINRQIRQGLKIPVIPHLAQKAFSLNPSLGQRRYPFRLSLKHAIERIGLRLRLLGEKMDENMRSG